MAAPSACKTPSNRCVANARSAMRPTKNGETIAPMAILPAPHPICRPEKCSAANHVQRVTYQEPQMKYWRSIIRPKRDFIAVIMLVDPFGVAARHGVDQAHSASAVCKCRKSRYYNGMG